MEHVMRSAVPLVLGSLALLLLCRAVRRLRRAASVQGLVVVITGASSGLGRGGNWELRQMKGILLQTFCTNSILRHK